MAIRETLQKYKKATTGIVAVLIVVAIFSIISQNRPRDRTAETTGGFFTADDGASIIRADVRKVRELERQNPPVYQAIVYRPADGGSNFIAYLTRYPPASQEEFAKAVADYKSGLAAAGNDSVKQEKVTAHHVSKMGAINATIEVKRPGATNKWVPRESPEGQEIVNTIKAPNGSTNVQMVFP